MDLQGNLERFSLAEVFQLLSFSHKTGTLGLQKEEEVAMVYFRSGDIVYAYTPQQKLPLGEVLKAEGILKEAQLVAALAQKERQPARRIGEIFVQLGSVTQPQMEEAVRRQVEELIYRILRWERGNFKFYENEFPTEEEVLIRISTENLILEGVRRMDELEQVKVRLPVFETVLRIKPIPPQRVREVSLKGNEWNVLALVDGRKDIYQIVERSNLDRLGTLKSLAALFLAGLVEPLEGEAVSSSYEKLEGLMEKLAVLMETYREKA